MQKAVIELLDELEEALVQQANVELALGMKAYMKHKFDFIGIQKPLRASICKPFFHKLKVAKADPAEILLFCWSKNEREWQYVGMDYAMNNKNDWPLDWLNTLEYCITHKSWWDTVDILAVHGAGHCLKKNEALRLATVEKWRYSKNLWLERSSLLFQLMYKSETNPQLLADLCQQFAASKEFFIQKAMGWALRQYARTNAAWVLDFVERHELPKLSKREALKHF